MKFSFALLAFAAVVAAGAPSQAGFIVNWTTQGGTNDFDGLTGINTISFAGFQANELTSITGSGYFHSHSGAPTTADLQIRLDGNWTSLFTMTSTNGSPDATNTFALHTPASTSFALGTVDGLRFLSDIQHLNTFHGFFDETFTFNAVDAQATPEPASMALLAMGGGLLAVGRKKLRRRQPAEPAA